MSAEKQAPELAKVLFADALKTGDDAVIVRVLDVLRSAGGASLVVRALADYTGINFDPRFLKIGEQFGALNVSAGFIRNNLEEQMDGYLRLNQEGRAVFRQKLDLG